MDSVVREWLRGACPQAEWDAAALHLGDVAAEAAALGERVGLIVAPVRTAILVEGADSSAYLHRRLSQSLKDLPAGRGAPALQLTGDGRLQSDLLVYRAEDAFLILAPEERAAEDAALLERYVINDAVEVQPLAAHELGAALAGPAAPQLLNSLLDRPLPPEAFEAARWPALLTVNLGGYPCRVLGDGRWRVPYYHLLLPRMVALPLLRVLSEACAGLGGRVAGLLAAERLRIESGVAWFGSELDERTIPLEAGLEGAISFDKGCYPGQEVIARITNLGHPARRLVRLRLELPAGAAAPAPGTALWREGREVGVLTSVAPGVGGSPAVALGYVAWAEREAPAVRVGFAESALGARIEPLRPALAGDQA